MTPALTHPNNRLQENIMTISQTFRGRGTYTFSAVLAFIGLLSFFVPDKSTWTEPQGLGPLKELVGFVAIALACVTVRLRLAIDRAVMDIADIVVSSNAKLELFIHREIADSQFGGDE